MISFAHRRFAVAVLFASVLLIACGNDAPRRVAPADSVLADVDSATASVSADPQPNAELLTPDGWGPLRIGMSRAEVVQAAGEDANPNAVGGPDPATCDEFRPRSAPEGILVMIRNGVLTRVSVSRNPRIATPAGIHIGDQGAAVLKAYGARATTEPHQYWQPPAKYITVWRDTAGAARRGIRYEIDANDDVVHMRAGDASIEAVEGCI